MNSMDDGIDLVDRIAQDLPLEVRAAYYRELNHCRSLPENDELLRVLRAMQFLTLLMRDVPERVGAERERLQKLLQGAMETLAEYTATADDHRSVIEKRLATLPEEVAQGLRPDVIAREINESLRQQFVESTMPRTAAAMTAIAAQLQTSVLDFAKSAKVLNDSHSGAADRARQAIQSLDQALASAARTASYSAEQLSSSFRSELKWSIYTFVSIALLLGLATGMTLQRWLDEPVNPAAPSPPRLDRAPVKPGASRVR